MRIALVVYGSFPERTASARRFLLMGKGLLRLGHEVHIIVPQRFEHGPSYEEIESLHVHWAANLSDASVAPSRRDSVRNATVRLVTALASRRLDWLCVFNPSLSGLFQLRAARRAGARVMTIYDDLPAKRKHPTLKDRSRFLRNVLADILIPRFSGLNVAISTYLENRLRATAPRVPTFLLPPMVDPDRFIGLPDAASAFRAQWSIGDAPTISYLGTYWVVDGVRVLLQSARQLLRTNQHFKVTISGAKHPNLDCDDVASLTRELALQDAVIETGWLKVDDVLAAMSAADILVVPKIRHLANIAGVPIKLPEYLSMRRAVVASRIGDIPRYVVDGESAALCEPGDVQSLTVALANLIKRPELRETLAISGREAALRHFDYRNSISRLEAIMNQIGASASPKIS